MFRDSMKEASLKYLANYVFKVCEIEVKSLSLTFGRLILLIEITFPPNETSGIIKRKRFNLSSTEEVSSLVCSRKSFSTLQTDLYQDSWIITPKFHL
jgi:hypothetical protein